MEDTTITTTTTTTTNTTMTINQFNKYWADYLEQITIEGYDEVDAQIGAGTHKKPFSYQDIVNGETLLTTMESLAFQPKEENPWDFLGVAKFQGRKPTKEIVESRYKHGIKLLGIARKDWGAEDLALLQKVSDKFHEARKEVLAGVNLAAKEWSKINKGSPELPLHLECSPELLSHVTKLGGKVATQLSNLQRINLKEYFQMETLLQPSDARDFIESVCKDTKEAKNTLEFFKDEPITLWAPTEQRHLQCLLQAIWDISLEGLFNVRVRLLVPHSHFPGCNTPDAITDLWTHQCLHPKWSKMLDSVQFLRQPTRCVFSGAFGPMHQIKAVAIITFSNLGVHLGNRIVDWMPTLLKYEADPTIIVDYSSEEELPILRALRQAKLPGLKVWDGPRKSLGSTGDLHRSRLTGTFDREKTTDMDIQLMIMHLRDQDALCNCFIGSKNLYGDPKAIMVEFTKVQALVSHLVFVAEAVLVSPRLALIHTGASAHDWGEMMTVQAISTPLEKIEKMKFRPSFGGRPFAKIQVLDKTAQGFKARAAAQTMGKTEEERRSLNVTINIQDLISTGKDNIGRDIMQALNSKAMNTYDTERAEGGELATGEWRLVKSFDDKWVGKIQVQAASIEDVKFLFRTLQGSAIEVDGQSCVIEVLSDFVRDPNLGADW